MAVDSFKSAASGGTTSESSKTYLKGAGTFTLGLSSGYYKLNSSKMFIDGVAKAGVDYDFFGAINSIETPGDSIPQTAPPEYSTNVNADSIAVNGNGVAVLAVTDGTARRFVGNSQTNSSSVPSATSVAFGRNKFVVGTSDGKIFTSSDDGVSFAEANTSGMGSGNPIQKLSCIGGHIVGTSSSGSVVYSSDGENFYGVTVGGSLRSITWSTVNGRYYTSDSNDNIFESEPNDPSTWSLVPTDSGYTNSRSDILVIGSTMVAWSGGSTDVSYDYGRTFAVINSSLPYGGAQAIGCTSDTLIIHTTYDGSQYNLMYSKSGTSWSRTNTPFYNRANTQFSYSDEAGTIAVTEEDNTAEYTYWSEGPRGSGSVFASIEFVGDFISPD